MSPLFEECPLDCPLCSGELCGACPGQLGCAHDPVHDVVERHQGVPRLSIAMARTMTPTLPLARPLLGLRIEIDCTNAEHLADLLATAGEIVRAKIANPTEAADFLETLGRIAKSRERVVVTIE